MSNKPFAIAIMGPTSVGKTELALQIADHLPVEIISVDSAQVYRDMNIGTAKPSAAVLQSVRHHLIDILDPAETYSAAQFSAQALELMQAIQQRGNIPMLVGGTMLYFRALEEGLAPLPKAQPELRAELQQQLEHEGSVALHQILKKVDPVAAARIRQTDPQRIIRALEIYKVTGQTMTALLNSSISTEPLAHKIIKFAVIPVARALLHQRIEQRFLEMLRLGFIDEVAALKSREDLDADLPSMRAVGYRQIWQYLAGALSYPDMIDKGVSATRQLAKRQLTWLRSYQELRTIEMERLKIDSIMKDISIALK